MKKFCTSSCGHPTQDSDRHTHKEGCRFAPKEKVLKKQDICTNYDKAEDRDILTRPLFAVNMRLFHSSPGYKKLVLAACEYIAMCCLHEANGVKSYIGYSGANAGIPWDIIAVLRDGYPVVMINAQLKLGDRKQLSYESCGSLPKAGTFMINRSTNVIVVYYDVAGEGHDLLLSGTEAFVAQHEVDHNDGILLTDRVREQG